MAITAFSGWSSSNEADNTDLNSIPLGEGLTKGPHVNGLIREMMKQLRLALGPSGSPQFTTIELGNSNDTTLSRLSAGVVTIEGVAIATATNTLTMTNKTLTAPALTLATGTVNLDNTGLNVKDTDASHSLGIKPGSNLTAFRTLTLTTGDADRTVTLSGNPTLSDWFDQSVKTTATPTFAQAIFGTGASNAAGSIYANSTNGLVISAKTGASFDLLFLRPNATTLAYVPVGTADFIFAGTAQFQNGTSSNPTMAFVNNADTGIYYTTATVGVGVAVDGAMVANFTTSAGTTLVGPALTILTTDDGASAGPTLTIDRYSASPANSDIVGVLRWRFNDSAGNLDEGIALRGVIIDPTSTSEDMRLQFAIMIGGSVATRFNMSDGFWAQGATGGEKGAGTGNFVAVYDDNVLLTDLVLDMAVTGDFDRAAYARHPVANELESWWLDPRAYADYWKEHRHLPGMISWLDEANRPSLGEQVTRLTATVEILAAHIDKLERRAA